MDRAVVHTKKEDSLYSNALVWVRNVPFREVPRSLVEEFKEHGFTPEEFYASDIWTWPGHYNTALYLNGEMVIFIYGKWDPLDRSMFIERIVSDRRIRRPDDTVIQLAYEELYRIAKEKKARWVWSMTDKPDFYESKSRGLFTLNREKVCLEKFMEEENV